MHSPLARGRSRRVQCLLSSLLFSALLPATALAQTTDAVVALTIVNAAEPVAVVQGDDLQIEITIVSDAQNELRSNDKLLLVRTDDGTVVSQGVRGKLDADRSAMVLLGTSGGNALGTLQAKYVKQNGTVVPDSSAEILVVADPAILEVSRQLDGEAEERAAADAALQASIAELQGQVTDLEAAFTTALLVLQQQIETEVAARIAADVAEVAALNQEMADRKAADIAEASARQAALAQEIADRKNGDGALQTALAQETTDRQAGDGVLQASIDDLEGGIVPGLADYVSVIDLMRDVDRDGEVDPVPTVRFSAVNLQVVDGLGGLTQVIERECVANQSCPADLWSSNRILTNGLGNVIIGYDEDTLAIELCSDGAFTNQADCEAADEYWAANQKHGSHNLVLGFRPSYSGRGGIIGGSDNAISGFRASVLNGSHNVAAGAGTVVVGGSDNAATPAGRFSSGGSFHSTVLGGRFNTASGDRATVAGGFENRATGSSASVSGGENNTAQGPESTISGGNDHTITGACNWGGIDEEFGTFLCDN